MRRSSLNFLIDALAFAALLLLLSTGMALEFQLPPGSGDREPRGFGPGAWNRPVETLWGWTRHEWGDFHFWSACALLAILAVHLVLHGKWIVCVVKGKPTDASGVRLALGSVGLAAVVLLTVLPWISPTRTTTRRDLRAASASSSAHESPGDLIPTRRESDRAAPDRPRRR